MAKKLAELLECARLNSGMIYRALTFSIIKNGISLDDIENYKKQNDIINICKKTNISFTIDGVVLIDNKEEVLNSSIIDTYTPYIAQIKEVREIVRYYQHSFVKKFKKCIADGRDLGTTVFPNATIKFFITADISIRARRRNTTVEKLKDRDYIDSHRSTSPMRKSNDSILIDTTNLNIMETILLLLQHIHNALTQYVPVLENITNNGRKIIILTGSASSGKTTIINFLKDSGYYTVPEAAEIVINWYKVNNKKLPWDNNNSKEDWKQFQLRILEEQKRMFSKIPEDINLIILDRGFEDTLAYYILKTSDDSIINNWPKTYEYFNIQQNNIIAYLLKPLNLISNDVRFETDDKEILEQYKAIKYVYDKLDYNIIVERRTNNINDRLKEINKIIKSFD